MRHKISIYKVFITLYGKIDLKVHIVLLVPTCASELEVPCSSFARVCTGTVMVYLYFVVVELGPGIKNKAVPVLGPPRTSKNPNPNKSVLLPGLGPKWPTHLHPYCNCLTDG